MGRVFSWGEIAEKRIPSVEDFMTVKKVVDSEASTMVGAGVLLGARTVGSFARRKHTIRSDYDLLYTPDPSASNDVRGRMQDLTRRIRDDFNIVFSPIEWDKYETGVARTPVTEFIFSRDPVTDNLVGQDPLLLLPAPHELHRITLIDFIRDRQRAFSEDSFFSPKGYEDNVPLELALQEIPHIALLLMATRHGESGTPALSKAEAIADLQGRLHPQDPLLRNVDFLLRTDMGYNRLLARAIDGRSTEEEYKGFIKDMTPFCHDTAYDFYCELPYRLPTLLDGKRPAFEGQAASFGVAPLERR